MSSFAVHLDAILLASSLKTAKELSRILKPLVDKTEYHVKNTKEFIKSIQDITLKTDKCLVSYYVEALFTSVPIQSALTITKKKLEEDRELHLRTSMSVQPISWLLEVCLKSTYFLFQGKFYQQLEGTAMGSPISPIIANLFMEDLETRALNTSEHPPSLWKRYVDDTFTIIKKDHKDTFLDHINSIDLSINFTSEDAKEDGSISFLDILIIPTENGKLNTTVYRKPTHTDMYLHWDSHHNIPSKYSVIGTLYHEQTPSAPQPSIYIMKKSTWTKLWRNANIQHGQSTEPEWRSKQQQVTTTIEELAIPTQFSPAPLK